MPPPETTAPYAIIEVEEKIDKRDYYYHEYLANQLLSEEEKKVETSIPSTTLRQLILEKVKDHIDYPQNKHLDLTINIPEVRDQGRFGSCAAHAAATVREWQETIDYSLTNPISHSPQVRPRRIVA